MIRTLFTGFCLAFGLYSTAMAQQYTIQNVARLDILPGYPTSSGHMIAAHIQLAPGWKTYWRAPGGNGIPPVFDWTGSQNVGAVTFHWPAPSVYIEDGVRTIGYKKELILPIGITPHTPGQPISLKGEVTFGICDDVCLPAKARFSLKIAGKDAASQKAIKSALARQPATAKSASIRTTSCQITPIQDGFRIEATLKSGSRVSDKTFSVIEFPHPDVWIEQDRTFTSGKTLTVAANLFAYGDTPLILDRSKIRLTLLGGPRAIELRGCPS